MNDKVVEIARFEQTTDAEMLANLLKSEGIDCYVRDGISSSAIFPGSIIGGAKVELLEKDVERAAEIMKDHGYEVSSELLVLVNSENSEMDNAEIENNRRKLSKNMTIILIIMAILLAVIIVLNKYNNG